MGNCMAVSKAKSPNRGRSSKQEQHLLSRALSSSSSSSLESSSSDSSSRSSSSRHCRSLVREASVEVLPGASDGITRLKLVISKQQVDDIVSGDYTSSNLDFFDNLVTSMLKQELRASC